MLLVLLPSLMPLPDVEGVDIPELPGVLEEPELLREPDGVLLLSGVVELPDDVPEDVPEGVAGIVLLSAPGVVLLPLLVEPLPVVPLLPLPIEPLLPLPVIPLLPLPVIPLPLAPLDEGRLEVELHAVTDNAHAKRMIHLDIKFS